jgi:hypothetical protein
MQVNHSMDWTVRDPLPVGRGRAWAAGIEPNVGRDGFRCRSRGALGRLAAGHGFEP